MKVPSKTLERKLINFGYGYVCGVDEVGIGCLAGPVVACAVRISPEFYSQEHPTLEGLRESKLLSAKQREKFAQLLIKQEHLTYAITSADVESIDRVNIFQAARQAMRRAVERLVNSKSEAPNPKQIQNPENSKTIILVDGSYEIPGIALDQQAIVKGDRDVFAIACASVIAKVYRDRMMVRYAKKYPGYGFEKHKGYGTKYHQTQLLVLGPCAIHRRSFAPVAKMI